MLRPLKKFLIGKPLRTSHLASEKITKKKALAVFSSDALSSTAYATEEILIVLAPAGVAALQFTVPVAMAIVGLLIILTISYRQVIFAYPSGGGAYVVAKENIGTYPGLVAGAALLIDYILTVSVSVAAGVAAITSAFQVLLPYKIVIALTIIAIITIANLRGIRESASLFAVPTYLFIVGILGLIITAAVKIFTVGIEPAKLSTQPVNDTFQMVSIFILLRAFSSGCTAVTGVEAISNGVPAFREPESKNAAITMIWMAIILMTLFLGLSFLADYLNIIPKHEETVVSQIAAKVFGRNIFYYFIQASTAMILFLAANTSYNGFPILASMLGRDGYLPRLLAMRGDRLVYSNGIITLGIVASLLIVIFHGDTHRLIPLYAVGVFLSFTLSQSGLVLRWFRLKNRGWIKRVIINGVGAVATGIATMIIAGEKFKQGAWIVVILIPLLVYVFRTIKSHYENIAEELRATGCSVAPLKPVIIIPIAAINKVVINTLDYAKSLSDNVKAVHISVDEEATNRLKEKWEQWNCGVKLTVIPSPYRSIIAPLLKYIENVEKKKAPNEVITVLIPEFVTKKWWHYFLHNQTGLLLRTVLLLRKDIVIATVPYHLHK